jgi:hypothetical protein
MRCGPQPQLNPYLGSPVPKLVHPCVLKHIDCELLRRGQQDGVHTAVAALEERALVVDQRQVPVIVHKDILHTIKAQQALCEDASLCARSKFVTRHVTGVCQTLSCVAYGFSLVRVCRTGWS